MQHPLTPSLSLSLSYLPIHLFHPLSFDISAGKNNNKYNKYKNKNNIPFWVLNKINSFFLLDTQFSNYIFVRELRIKLNILFKYETQNFKGVCYVVQFYNIKISIVR